MNKYIESLLGVSPATLIRGLRFGPRETQRANRASCFLTQPFENRQLKEIPVTSIENILGARKASIKLNIMKYEDGMMPLRDALALLPILVAEQPKEILEIGTYMGHTSRLMAENVPDAIVHTIDLPQDFSADLPPDVNLPKDDFHLIRRRIVGREFKNQDCESRIVQHFGDSAKLDFTKIGKPTFFFIDGSHTYEYCKLDSRNVLPWVRARAYSSGTIATKLIPESFGSSLNGGPRAEISPALMEPRWLIGRVRDRLSGSIPHQPVRRCRTFPVFTASAALIPAFSGWLATLRPP